MAETILFEFLNFDHWSLFVIWCLGFGAYLKRMSIASRTALTPTNSMSLIAFIFS
jgi:hypothetical protein